MLLEPGSDEETGEGRVSVAREVAVLRAGLLPGRDHRHLIPSQQLLHHLQESNKRPKIITDHKGR